MFQNLSMAFAVVVLALSAFAGDENPFKDAKVGDWVEYKSSSEANGYKIESKLKETVSAKTDKEATVSVEMEMGGKKNPPSEMKIDLTKGYDLTTADTQPGAKAPKVEITNQGDETIAAGGKEYKTHWIETKKTVAMGPASIEQNVKFWSSKDVPLSGLVKMVTTMNNGGKMTMELTGSGRK
ncbi:MAG TPA: hypothetical protein VKX17_17360 [Planctomycetota bacterium]|nr:hypothetical protein [Planctomycetota bacterium]